MQIVNHQSEIDIQTFGDFAQKAIAKHAEKIFKYESKVLKDKDPENLHQMRVGMRRLRSAIAVFDQAVNLPESVSEPLVAKMAKILGKLRDIDVLKQSLTHQYQSELEAAEPKTRQQVINRLDKRRKPALKKVQSTLQDDIYLDFKADLQNWLDRPDYTSLAQLPIVTVLPDLLLPLVCQLLLHPGWLVGTEVKGEHIEVLDLEPQAINQLLETESEKLHELRKWGKRSRYNLELFTSFYDSSYSGLVDQIEAIQEILGAIQDTAIMDEYLESVWQSEQSDLPVMTGRLVEIRQKKYVAWQQLQRQFLDFEYRQYIRRVVQQPKPNQSLN